MQFDIPLVVLGKDSASEYSGEDDVVTDSQINREWFNRYAANDGMTPERIAEKYALDPEKLEHYGYPP
jgi:hypothetical protein